jgi:hypothetical protein
MNRTEKVTATQALLWARKIDEVVERNQNGFAMNHPTLTLWLTLPHDPVGAGNREDEDDGKFKYEATYEDFRKFCLPDDVIWEANTYTWKEDMPVGNMPSLTSDFKAWLESDPSRFSISGETAVRNV